jgi:hypothetical protein
MAGSMATLEMPGSIVIVFPMTVLPRVAVTVALNCPSSSARGLSAAVALA